MASPLGSGKKSVNLGSPGVPGSRIRREPPPQAKVAKLELRDPEERDRQAVIVGILVFALALVIIIAGVSSFAGWTPRSYTIRIEQ
jgi:hypothetical protein